jgi:dTDP-glucose 4,6-dehydratase
MKTKTIVVTGGLGFIGSNLINLLLKKNYKVINVDRVSYSSNYYNVEHLKNNNKYKFYKVDINNKIKIIKILFKERPVAIFNLAADTHVDRSIDSPYPFIKNNILGVFNLLEASREYYKKNKKFRLIHISTDEVYGDILKYRSSEGYPYKPSSPYAASKASSDHLVYSYYKTYNLPIIVTNCSNNYGPNQHPEKLIPKMIYNIIDNKDLPVYGKGTNSREWIFVEDHCKALMEILKKGKTGEFYNIGSNENLNNLDVCKKLLRIGKKMIKENRSQIKFVKDRPGHDIRYALNSNKIKNELKWKKDTDFNTGIVKTFKWYLNNLEYFKSFKKKDITSRLGIK